MVVRHIFGSEPHDAEIARFMNGPMFTLLAEAAAASAVGRYIVDDFDHPRSPKRREREAASAVREQGISTRSQPALQQQFETRKLDRGAPAQEEREAKLERKWALKREKAKARHRGH